MYMRLSGKSGKIDSRAIFDKFGGVCFKCHRKLHYTSKGQRDFNLDHTLPARLLWPLTTKNATLLCFECNNQKHDRWPSDFYSPSQLKALARLTGYEYALLSGQPMINDAAVTEILVDPDSFIEEWIPYHEEIRRIRSLIEDYAKVDIFEKAAHVPDFLRASGK